MPRDILYERINKRVDLMFEKGLYEEAKAVFEGGNLSRTARQAIGYKQLFEHFEGKTGLDEARENIKKETRHFAKRQVTWFSHQKDIIMIERTGQESEEEILERMSKFLGKAGK